MVVKPEYAYRPMNDLAMNRLIKSCTSYKLSLQVLCENIGSFFFSVPKGGLFRYVPMQITEIQYQMEGGVCVCMCLTYDSIGWSKQKVSITNDLGMTFAKFCPNFNIEVVFSKTSYNIPLLDRGIVNQSINHLAKSCSEVKIALYR